MKIGIVIPIIQETYIHDLLTLVEKNSIAPHRILIIDNSQIDVKMHLKMHLSIIKPQKPLGVNASWNLGVKWMLNENVDLIGVFNDDLLIEEYFFEKLQDAALRFPEGKIFCPNTVNEQHLVSIRGPVECRLMNRREGWAWTIRTSVAKTIPPIPDSFRTFCGDDWYWHHSQNHWFKMMNNLCHHFVGKSVKLNGSRQDLRIDKKVFAKYIKP